MISQATSLPVPPVSGRVDAAPDPLMAVRRSDDALASASLPLLVAPDRLTLTPGGRLTLLTATAEALLRDVDAVLERASGSAGKVVDTGLVARLASIVPKVGAAMDAVLELAGSLTTHAGKPPDHTGQIADLVTHASASLQAAVAHLVQIRHEGDAVSRIQAVPIADPDHRTSAAGHPENRPIGGTATPIAGADNSGIDPTLAAVQAAIARLADPRTTILDIRTASQQGRSLWRQRIGTPGKRPRPPVLPGLLCLVIGCLLLSCATFGVLQRAMIPAAVLITLAWCLRWLAWWFANRHRDQATMPEPGGCGVGPGCPGA